ncbi:hypothetical protein BFN02_13205 [Staphylococcus equorum]|nr:hypothetical protein BFN02_13205 [Staphylococcus equorum]
MLVDEFGQREAQRAQPLACDGRDLEDPEAARLDVGAHHLGELASFGHVDLVQGHDLRSVQQRDLPLGHLVRAELGEDDVEVGQRIATRLEGGAVEHVQQGAAALDVAEELEAEPLALAGALDQAGNVGDGVPAVTGLHHSEVGVQCRERVVGDLRTRGRQCGDQARLARGRVAHEGDIGDGLQLEHDRALLAGRAEQREAGGLALG